MQPAIETVDRTTNEPSLWYMDAVFYELYVRAFKDSNGDGNGDIQGVIEKLDYLSYLGVDCIWLLPMYPSPLIDDGYDIADYHEIHEDYGTVEDFEQLLREAHARGIRVITDLVVNHTSDQHPWFIESRSSVDSPLRDWYVWNSNEDLYREARIIFLDTEDSNWAYDEETKEYYWHRFYTEQPDLNFDNPEVREAMLQIIAYWLDKGIDGFRVDAVPYLYERQGTNCENLPETHDYVKEMRRFVEARWPEAVLLAEANQLPDEVREYFGNGDEFHMAFHFPVMPRIFMALHTGDVRPLLEVMEQTPPIPVGTQWCVFLRNHDELTLEMVTEAERKFMWDVYAPEDRMRLNLGIRRRLAPLLNNIPERIMLANHILFTLPGTPIVYYGDEIGMGDNIALPDRHGVRTPMQWDDSKHGGFSQAEADNLYSPVIDDPVFGYQQVNVASQIDDPASMLNRTRALIALRKRFPVFARGSLEFIDVGNPGVLALVREYEDVRVIAVHNLKDEPQSIELDGTLLRRGQLVDLMRDEQISVVENGSAIQIELQGFESRLMQVVDT